MFLDKTREEIKWKKVFVVVSPAGELLAACQDVEGLTARELTSLGWVRRGVTEVSTQAASTRRFIFGDTVCVLEVAQSHSRTRQETRRVVLGAQRRKLALMLETIIADNLREQQPGQRGDSQPTDLRETIASHLRRELQAGLASTRRIIEHQDTLAVPWSADVQSSSGAGVGSVSPSITMTNGNGSSHPAGATTEVALKSVRLSHEVLDSRDVASDGHGSRGMGVERGHLKLPDGAAELQASCAGGGGGMDGATQAAVMKQLQHLTAQMSSFGGMMVEVAQKLDMLEQLQTKVDAKVEGCLLKLNSMPAAPEPSGSQELEQIGAAVTCVSDKVDAGDGKVEQCVRQLRSLSPGRRDQARASSGADQSDAFAASRSAEPLPVHANTSSSGANTGISNMLDRRGQAGEEEEVWSQLPQWPGR